ncbi:MAG: hypothetical protein ACYC1M_03505 [Armatimonadota bacterium]
MRISNKMRTAVGVMAGVLCVSVAYAQLGGLLKGLGVGFLVDKFGKDINKVINGLYGNNKFSSQYDTKVVPILSVGSGGYMGAAQVVGPKDQVAKVKACAQVEGEFKAIGGVRLRGLIPIDSKGLSDIKRVEGVGVAALIDFKL